MSAQYDTDFFAWTQEQIRLLQQHQYESLDVEHLIEELASLGKQQCRELRHRLGILLGHLLKWQYQPQHRSNSWEATIRKQRRRLSEHLDDNPQSAILSARSVSACLCRRDGLSRTGNQFALQHVSVGMQVFTDPSSRFCLLPRGADLSLNPTQRSGYLPQYGIGWRYLSRADDHERTHHDRGHLQAV